MGCDRLPAVAAHVEVAQVVGEDEDKIGLLGGGDQAGEDLKNKKKGEDGSHGIVLEQEGGDGWR